MNGRRLILAAWLLAVAGGCSQVSDAVDGARQAAANDQLRNDLKVLGLAYHQFHDRNKAGPANWDDALTTAGDAEAIQRLRDLDYQVAWGLRFRDVVIGTSNCLAAHPPDAEDEGGFVLLLDGSVRYMHPPDVEAALAQRASIYPPAEPANADSSETADADSSPSRPTSQEMRAAMENAARELAESSSGGADEIQAEAQNEAPQSPVDAAAPAIQETATSETEAEFVSGRTWSDASGSFQVQAEMIKFHEGVVTLLRGDGQTVEVPLKRLSESDRKYVQNIIFPPDEPPAEPVALNGASQNTPLLGGDGGVAFRDVGEQHVVGFRFGLGSWAGQAALSKLEPLYKRASGADVASARPGYAVGGLEVNAGKYVHGVRVVFMRQTGSGALDPSDSYTSPWIGRAARRRGQMLGGDGQPVVGVHGRRGLVMDAVGLVVKQP